MLFAPKDLEYAAELLGALIYDGRCATRVIDGQRRRLQDFARADRARLTDRRDRGRQLGSLKSDEGSRLKIAFIVQRYGTEILGGSEYHCRLIAERLAPKHQVDVLTTCARTTSPGRTSIRKAPTASAASPSAGSPTRGRATSHAFNRYSDWIFNNAHTREDEMEWLKQQGPWCPALLEYLERQPAAVRRAGLLHVSLRADRPRLRIAPHKSILVPTAHDEPAIRLGIYRELFSLPAGIAYNTEVERRFLTTHFSIRAVEEETVGCGVDLPQRAGLSARARRPAATRTTSRRGRCRGPTTTSPTFRPHLAERGADVPAPASAARPVRALRRPDRSRQGLRGADRVLQHLRAGGRGRLAGADGRQADAAARRTVHPVRRPACRPGALQALEAATVVVVPSPYESLSLLALESFAVGTPVLANARSEVLVEHCRKSNAGLYYADRDEFIRRLKLLVGAIGSAPRSAAERAR